MLKLSVIIEIAKLHETITISQYSVNIGGRFKKVKYYTVRCDEIDKCITYNWFDYRTINKYSGYSYSKNLSTGKITYFLINTIYPEKYFILNDTVLI